MDDLDDDSWTMLSRATMAQAPSTPTIATHEELRLPQCQPIETGTLPPVPNWSLATSPTTKLLHEWREMVVVRFVPERNSADGDWKLDALRECGINVDTLRQTFEDLVKRIAGQGRG